MAIQSGAAISAANLAETLTRLVERGDTLEGALQRLRDHGLIGQSLTVFPLDEGQAAEIARLRPLTRAAGLSLADHACLALARSLGLPTLTADRVWSGLQVGVTIDVVR